MSKVKAIRNEIAGKAKRLTGEVLGDQKLHDEGKGQEQAGRKESEKTGGEKTVKKTGDKTGRIKPLGNIDQLT